MWVVYKRAGNAIGLKQGGKHKKTASLKKIEKKFTLFEPLYEAGV